MKMLAIVAAVIVAIVALFKLNYPTYTYRYRLTVNIEVDGQVRSGSSVIEVRVSKQPRFLPEVVPFESSVRGEAVVIDLDRHGQLVALLASGRDGADVNYIERIVPSHFKINYFEPPSTAPLPSLRGRWEISRTEFPTFILFDRPDDPGSARHLDEADSDSSERIRVRGVSVEMTTDSVTRGIERRLGWWNNPGRPALASLKAAGLWTAAAIDAESAFRR